MAERMTEEKVAALKADLLRAEREDQGRRELAQDDSRSARRALVGGDPELAEKRRAYLDAAAQLEREKRADADAAAGALVAANQEMAAASRDAARSSAEAAQAAKRSAFWTFVAAVVAAGAVAIQAFQAWQAQRQRPPPAPVSGEVPREAGHGDR